MGYPVWDDRSELPPAVRNLYPDVRLSDIQWDRVIKVLEERGTKKDQHILKMIKRDVRTARHVYRLREERRRNAGK